MGIRTYSTYCDATQRRSVNGLEKLSAVGI